MNDKQNLIAFTEAACEMLKSKYFDSDDKFIANRFAEGKVDTHDMRVAFWINEKSRFINGTYYATYNRQYFPALKLQWLTEKERKSLNEDNIMHARMCEALLPLRRCINQMVLDGFKMSREAISELMLDTIKSYDFGIPTDKFYEKMAFVLQEIPLLIANGKGTKFTQIDFDRERDKSWDTKGVSTDILTQYTKNIMNIMCSPRDTLLESPVYLSEVKLNIPAYITYMNRYAHAVAGHSTTTHAFIEFCVKAGFDINNAGMIEALSMLEADFESEMDFLRKNGFEAKVVFESENDYFVKNRFDFSYWITNYFINKCEINLFEGVTDGWKLTSSGCFVEKIIKGGTLRQAPNWKWIKDEIARNNVTFAQKSPKRNNNYRDAKFWENIFALTDFDANSLDNSGRTSLEVIKAEWCKAPHGTSAKAVRTLLMKTAEVFIKNGADVTIKNKYGNDILSVNSEAEELFVKQLKQFLS